MKKLAFLIVIFIFLAGNIFAQDLRKKAETHPLDCALYLLSKDKNSVVTDDLALVFFELERYDDALRAIDFDDNDYSRFLNLSTFGKQLFEKNKKAEANKFLTKAFSVLRDDEEWHSSRNMPLFVSTLVEMNRAAEAFEIIEHQDDDETKADIFLALGETYVKLEQKENAIKFLRQAFELRAASDDHYLPFAIAGSYIKLRENEEALTVLKQIEGDILQSGETHKFIQLIPFFLQLGKLEKAELIWQTYGNLGEPYEIFSYSKFLIDNGKIEKARFYLAELQNKKEFLDEVGKDLVGIYLKLNDVETAVKIAKTMSDEDDNYWQQDSFIKIADKFIADGKNDAALEIVDFAFQRARKTGEEHPAGASTGASPLTRKIIYLRQIREKYFKLNRFEKGLSVVNSLKIRDGYFQRFYAESLVESVKLRIKTLPRKTIYKLLDDAQKIFDEDEDNERTRIELSVAEIYAQIGEKTKAVEILTKILEAQESYYRIDDMLLAAGKIFEQNKLKADSNLKKVLLDFIKDVEE